MMKNLLAPLAGVALISAPFFAAAQDLPPEQSFEDRARPFLCGCDDIEPIDVILKGQVVDAQVFLSPGTMKPAKRQATILNVLSALEGGNSADYQGRIKVFHLSKADRCGVQFDYGKSYSVYVRKTLDKELETDFCLMRSGVMQFETEAEESETAAE